MVAEASDERQHYQRDTDCDVLMKCVRRGISFTTDMRQDVDIPVTKTTPTITLSVVAVSFSLNPEEPGRRDQQQGRQRLNSWCAPNGSGPRGIAFLSLLA